MEIGETLGERLSTARRKRGLHQVHAAEAVDRSENMIGLYERDASKPPDKILKRLAELYDVPFEWLKYGNPKKSTLSGGVYRVPVLGRVPAGFPMYVPPESVVSHMSLPHAKEGQFALRVCGDSMSPTLQDGDYVIFEPSESAESNDIVIANDQFGDSTVKRFKKKNEEAFLVPDNPNHPIHTYQDGWRIVGIVVDAWSRKELKRR